MAAGDCEAPFRAEPDDPCVGFPPAGPCCRPASEVGAFVCDGVEEPVCGGLLVDVDDLVVLVVGGVLLAGTVVVAVGGVVVVVGGVVVDGGVVVVVVDEGVEVDGGTVVVVVDEGAVVVEGVEVDEEVEIDEEVEVDGGVVVSWRSSASSTAESSVAVWAPVDELPLELFPAANRFCTL